ncbi:MAG: Gfo/Idh/MocA family oxidoreductase [Candidatus Thermoplasmatota archaeon]
MDTLKVGIIGYGKVGRIRQRIIENHTNLSLIGICDVIKPKNLSSKYSFYTDYKKLLKENLDAVFICTPNRYSSDIAVAALQKNIHVFCEKPPGRTVDDIKKIIKAEQKHKDVKVKFGFNHRYHDGIREAKAIIDSGRLGSILWLRGIYGKSGGIDFEKNWRSDRDIAGGGILLDQGIHMLDLFRFFCGDFQEIKSFVTNAYWNIDVEDNVFAILRNNSNQTAMIHSSSTQWKHMFKLDIFLRDGYVIINGILSSTHSYGQESLIVARRQFENEAFALGNPREEIIYFSEDNSWKLEIDEFVDCIINSKPIRYGTSTDALKAMELVYKIYNADTQWRKKMKKQSS